MVCAHVPVFIYQCIAACRDTFIGSWTLCGHALCLSCSLPVLCGYALAPHQFLTWWYGAILQPIAVGYRCETQISTCLASHC